MADEVIFRAAGVLKVPANLAIMINACFEHTVLKEET